MAPALRAAETAEDHKRHSARLRAAARKAKRRWADDVIGKSNLWEVATWRHGRRMNKIPPLRAEVGLAHTHADISQILSNRFFVMAPPEVPRRLEDDPPPRATRELPKISENIITELLADTSNLSSPGASGQTWRLIKWAWTCTPEILTDLIMGCVRAGHHPHIWRQV
jgi:hypothetical protein